MSDFSSPTSKRSGLLRILGTVLAFALLIYLLSQQGWDEIAQAIHQIPAWRLILALALMIISRLAVVARWHVLLRSAGLPVSFRQTMRVTFAGLFSSNFLPTTIGGDVVRLAGVIQLEFDPAICAASLIVDRLVGITGMAMAVPFGLPSLFQNRTGSFQPASISPSLAAIPLQKWWKKAWEKGGGFLHRILNALGLWLKQPKALALSLLFSWINMLSLFGVIQILLSGMGDELPFWLIGGLYSLVYFVTLIPISINGYGLQEISMTLVFSSLGNASMSSGLTMALLFRTIMMIASLPGALFVPGMISATKETETPQV
jgi:uncharacterized membrane protein YbhN (UPF0104 family)